MFCIQKDKNNVKKQQFYCVKFVGVLKSRYICSVFFMVLDLRLTKIGCRETINFFVPPYH